MINVANTLYFIDQNNVMMEVSSLSIFYVSGKFEIILLKFMKIAYCCINYLQFDCSHNNKVVQSYFKNLKFKLSK